MQCYFHADLFRDLPQLVFPGPANYLPPWGRLTGFSKKEQSIIGEACEVGEKAVIKQCSVGANCRVGAKAKLNNCIIMNGVIIGER